MLLVTFDVAVEKFVPRAFQQFVENLAAARSVSQSTATARRVTSPWPYLPQNSVTHIRIMQ